MLPRIAKSRHGRDQIRITSQIALRNELFAAETTLTPKMQRRLLLVCLGFALAACSGSTNGDHITYVDPAEFSIFSIPGDWNLYELKDLEGLGEFPFTHSVEGMTFPVIAGAGFTASPTRDPNHLTMSMAEVDFPIGSMSVRQLGADERERLSRFILTQSVIPYRSYPNMVEEFAEDFSFGSGFEGVRRLVRFVDPENTQRLATAYMVVVTDPADQRMYSIVAGCSEECFASNQNQIVEVIDSWMVNTKS